MYIDRITILPNVCQGQPTIRGMRVTVRTIVDFISAGESPEAIIRAIPYINADDIKAASEFARHNSY